MSTLLTVSRGPLKWNTSQVVKWAYVSKRPQVHNELVGDIVNNHEYVKGDYDWAGIGAKQSPPGFFADRTATHY